MTTINLDIQDVDWMKKKNTKQKIEKSQLPDAYSLAIYDWCDKQLEKLEKAGLKIPGQHPRGSKEIGKQIESDLYSSLRDRINKYLNTIASDTPQHEVLNGVMDEVKAWQSEQSGRIDKAFNDLYIRGLTAGVIDSGVEPTIGIADKMAMNFIKANPNRIADRVVTFGENVIEKFRPIIAESYEPEGEFSLQALVKKMREVVPGERYKIERIARTETASISNLGRIIGWSKDPDRYFFQYSWNHTPDNRAKFISLHRGRNSPYSFPEICFLWQSQEELVGNKWWADQYNQRCSVSRSPIKREWKDNRFKGQESSFRLTTPLGFDYEAEGLL